MFSDPHCCHQASLTAMLKTFLYRILSAFRTAPKSTPNHTLSPILNTRIIINVYEKVDPFIQANNYLALCQIVLASLAEVGYIIRGTSVLINVGLVVNIVMAGEGDH